MLERPPAAWWALTALFMLAAVAGLAVPASVLDWQPQAAWNEPWRWWTPVAVHYSGWHLGANLVGALCVAWLAWSANTGRSMAVAWAVSWPLTHLGLLLRPDLLHYGGLSGVLHAGVAVIAIDVLRRRAAWGALLLTGLALKVLLEKPWGPAVQQASGMDIAVAPWGHLSGAVAGALCAGLATVRDEARWRRARS